MPQSPAVSLFASDYSLSAPNTPTTRQSPRPSPSRPIAPDTPDSHHLSPSPARRPSRTTPLTVSFPGDVVSPLDDLKALSLDDRPPIDNFTQPPSRLSFSRSKGSYGKQSVGEGDEFTDYALDLLPVLNSTPTKSKAGYADCEGCMEGESFVVCC